MNPVSQRLLSQQLAAPQFKDPAEVVSWFGAMQAQDYKSMRWAVSMRTRRPSGKAFEQAYNDGRIIRTHLQRTTWQLLAGEDLGWMLKLCRRKALSGLRGWMHANNVDIPLEEEKRISGIFGEALAGHRSVQKEFLAEALRERDIQMTEQRFSYHLRLAELSGLLCSGDLHPTKRTLALAAEKVRNPLVLSHEEALAVLTRKYFRSHSPATLEDFVWWSGLNVNDCRRGIAALGGELQVERWKSRGERGAGRDFFVHAEARTRGFRRGSVLLPSSIPSSPWTAASWATGPPPPMTAVSPSSTTRRQSRPSPSTLSSPPTAPPSSSSDKPQQAEYLAPFFVQKSRRVYKSRRCTRCTSLACTPRWPSDALSMYKSPRKWR